MMIMFYIYIYYSIVTVYYTALAVVHGIHKTASRTSDSLLIKIL